jgi:hypothetical protein
MSSSTFVRTILGLSLVAATMVASPAQAQTEDKKTYFTFSAPIALPGVTLPAGRYLFHIVDTTTTRKVIQVVSEDGKKPFAMMNSIPDTRRDPKDATVAFYETPRGTPAAVKSWWYSGETIGYQFIYPRAQARQIAQNIGKPVLTTRTEDTKSAVTHIDAAGKDVDEVDAAASNSASTANDSSATSTVFNRTPPQVAQAAPAPAPAPVPTESSRVARNELPRTASDLPLVGLIGMLSALGYMTLRYGKSLRG